MSDYDDAITAFAGEHADALARSLARRFPAMPADRVEECMQDVLLEACTPERNRWFVDGHAAGGDDELRRRLYTAGWRHIRGELRKVGTQRTARLDTDYDVADSAAHTDDRAEAGQLLSWVGHQVHEAAERFGRAREHTLRRALNSLVRSGDPVKPLAERHGLPRRYLAEASVWLRRRLTARADDE